MLDFHQSFNAFRYGLLQNSLTWVCLQQESFPQPNWFIVIFRMQLDFPRKRRF
jgi:hypothetical protein